MTLRIIRIIVLGMACVSTGIGQESSTEITAEDIREHIKYLASDELEGRWAGAAGNEKAADYIAQKLQEFGVSPGGDDGAYLQSFKFVSTVRQGDANALTFDFNGAKEELEAGVDFRAMTFSSDGTVRAPLVFAGYGISAPDSGYDDYAGLDVEGKVVVMLRFAPDGDGPKSRFFRLTSLRNKTRVAREHGASALILITGPTNDEEDELVRTRYDRVAGSSGIPTITMKRSVLEPHLARLGMDLKTIQDSLLSTMTPNSFQVPDVEVTLTTEIVKVIKETANVVGILEGTDDDLRGETIVLGAHFDHLGYGGPGSGSMVPDTSAIHNGADDNASGSAGLLELAQKFAQQKRALRRTFVFAFFSAEEIGIIGSNFYVNNPPIPLTQTVAMMNMDMIGRMVDSSLHVGGTETAPEWEELLWKFNADSILDLTEDPDGFGPSDHASFYGKNIPVLFFFTGTHEDYHHPGDDWEKINYEGEELIVRYVYEIANAVNTTDKRPVYARVESSARSAGQGDRRSFRVVLGLVPDFTGETEEEGMKVSSVRPNGAAERAGIQGGDIIVKMAGKDVLNIYDYMGILGELKVGQMVEVELLREGKRVIVTATMQKRK
jgi:hypothetical protein